MTPPSDSTIPSPGAARWAVARLAGGVPLDEREAQAAFREIMAGEASAVVVAALLTALRIKGESPEEIAGAARALRGAMLTVAHPRPDLLVDTCGTGGGTITTVNISTAAAFVAAGAGVPIAKHGNRSFTSRSGSADLLEALGIAIDLSPDRAATVLDTAGFVFLFAPTYHPAMRHAAPVRRELAIPTLLNLVGPLANPARAGRQVVGVADRTRAPRMAAALARLGSAHAVVVHADIGMDEISPVGTTSLWEVRDGNVVESVFDPASVGLSTASLEGLEGGVPEENAEKILALLERPGAAAPALRAAVLLNAAAAIFVAGLVTSWDEAVVAATAALHGGKGRERLETIRRASAR